jgi:hypothetical protein
MNKQYHKYHSLKKQTTSIQTTVTTTIPAIDLFSESIKSPATRYSYLHDIRQFERATGFKLSKEATDGKALQNRLIEYVITLKHAGKSTHWPPTSLINEMLEELLLLTKRATQGL